jgi:hypothetical protein
MLNLCNILESSLMLLIFSTFVLVMKMFDLINVQFVARALRLRQTSRLIFLFTSSMRMVKGSSLPARSVIVRLSIQQACENIPRKSMWLDQSRMSANTVTSHSFSNVHWTATCVSILVSGRSLVRHAERVSSIFQICRST